MSLLTDIIIKYWPVFPAVFVAGVVDAIAGGGGLISLPTYMLAGLCNVVGNWIGVSFFDKKPQ